MPRLDPDMMTDPINETAYAKVNIALHVRERRADGYHALESLFIFADRGDELSAVEADDGAIDLFIDGPFGAMLDAGPGNLVMKAARALQSYLGAQRGAAIRLTKYLPVASGIGGGSADAAATLRLLTRLWDVRMEDDELAGLALDLGSDVPACVASVTQLVKGRGEIVRRHPVAGLSHMGMLLVNPGVALSTAQVFGRWDGIDHGPLDARSLDTLIALGRNDLEVPAIAEAPVIADVLNAMRQQPDVRVARMSGSGATCYALFDDSNMAASAAQAIGAAHPDWWVMETGIRTK